VTRGVTIVIPTWNGLELLERFLPSVITAAHHYSNNSGAPTEIVVVDDGSKDTTVDWLVSRGFVYNELNDQMQATVQGGGVAKPRVPGTLEPEESEIPATRIGGDVSQTTFTVLKNSSNLGFGETCNRGFRVARHPLVLLLNNDVEIASDAIAPLVANFTDESIFAVHCRVFELQSGRQCGTGKLGSFARGSIRVHRSYVLTGRETGNLVISENRSLAGPLYSMFAGGGSAMFDKRNFLDIGGFESLLSPFYWEDVELSYRAWKRGLIVLYEPRSVARHQVSSTIGKLDRRGVRKIEQRNRLIYHWIHLQDPSLLLSHLFWLCILTVTAPLRLKFDFIPALLSAIKRLPRVRNRRREEKRAARKNDREVFAIFEAMLGRSDLFAYDSYEELEQKRGSTNR